MKRQTKLTSEQQAQLVSAQQQSQQQSVTEFPSVEELLRHDAQQTPVPPAIAHRLQESVSRMPPPRPWWRRWLCP